MYKLIFTKQAEKFLKKHKELEPRIIEIFRHIIKEPFVNSRDYDSYWNLKLIIQKPKFGTIRGTLDLNLEPHNA